MKRDAYTVDSSSNDRVVEISLEEYENLMWDSRILDALRAAGVDNWEGYAEAMQMLDDMYEGAVS